MKRILALLILLPALSFADTRQVGAASMDITPDYPVRLSGYGSRRAPNTGISQRIYAKALAIGSDAEGPAVIVTVDNCGVPAAMRDEVLKRLATKTKVTSERFALCSSHTHCAPMLIGILPNLFGMDIPAEHLPAIERYTRELTDHIEKAVLTVAGVKSHTAAKNSPSFKVEGDFNAKDVMAALAKAGYTGKASK